MGVRYAEIVRATIREIAESTASMGEQLRRNARTYGEGDEALVYTDIAISFSIAAKTLSEERIQKIISEARSRG